MIGTLSTRDETSLLEKEYSPANCRVTSSIKSAAIVTLRVAFFGSGFIRPEINGDGLTDGEDEDDEEEEMG